MTHDTAVLDTAVHTAVATGTDTAVDPARGLDIRIDAAHHLLAAVWPSTTGEPEPDWLRAVAAAVVDEPDRIPALPTPDAAHHLLAAALLAARDAHTAALAQRQAADDAWHEFRADVRRRAGEAVNDKRICREGTNTALHEFGIDPLRVEYRVQLLVPVSINVRADDEDDAYRQAEDQIRDAFDGDEFDADTYDLRRYSAEVIDDDIDPDD